MSVQEKHKSSIFPARISDLLDPSRFFSKDLFDINNDLLGWNVPFKIPSVNITENNGDYLIEMAAPGLEKGDFKIEVDKRNITISAEKKEESKEKTKNYTRQEYSYNSFSRSFLLPEDCVQDNIKAQYDNGVLKVTVPKKELTPSTPKKEIKVG